MSGKGHVGGSLSCVEILTYLFFDFLKPQDEFILSKGHAAVSLYSALTIKGLIPEYQLNIMNDHGILGEHPSCLISGIKIDTGSLGHGLGIGTGMALSNKIDKKDGVVVVLMGDGECYEGSVWEAAMFAAHHGLPIIAIIDRNDMCTLGSTEQIVRMEPLVDKWTSFGWHCTKVNGHEYVELQNAFCVCRGLRCPSMIIANTIKGKGLKNLEGKASCHHMSFNFRDII